MPYQVQFLCSTGVGSRSLFDHLASPIVVCPSFPSGVLTKSTNASFDRNGAVKPVLLGSLKLPMVERSLRRLSMFTFMSVVVDSVLAE